MSLKRKDDSSKIRNKEVVELCQQIYDGIKSQQSEDGRLLCETFLSLPSKRSIKTPIDLLKIQTKLKNEEYHKFEEFDDDFTLVVQNAKQFYKKGTQEFKDASDLWDFYHEKKKLLAEAFTHSKVDEVVSRTTTRKRSVAASRKNRESVDDDVEMEVDTPAAAVVSSRKSLKRKPKGSKNNDAESETDDTKSNTESVEETVNTTKKKRSMESNNSSENYANNDVPTNLADYLEDYFDVICSCQDGGRYLANIFHLLPSHQDYPDYYEIITEPIDLKTIGKKILNNKYKNVDAMEQDLIKMVNNAKRYNDPKSQLYKDSQHLRKIILNTKSDIEQAMKSGRSIGIKTREKKHAIVLEIASLEGNDAHVPANEDEEEDADNDDDEEEEDAESNDEIDDSNEIGGDGDESANEEDDVFSSLYNYIKNYKFGNQILIDPFMKLPNRRIYPDYYEEIKKPIALSHIKANVKKGKYGALKDLFKDIELMFKNAMSYNREDSAIYINAKRLLNATGTKFSELEQKESALVRGKSAAKKSEKRSSGQTAASATVDVTDTTAATAAALTFNMSVPIVTAPNPSYLHLDLKEKLLIIYNYINDYKEEGTKRELAGPFKYLPSKLDYPDYYNVIKKPIDLSKIYNKIISGHYATCEDMILDYAQCFENACIYNEPGSQIYKDALLLQKLVFFKRIEVDTNLNDDVYNICDVNAALQDILVTLFESTFNHQDADGRKLSDSFLELFNAGTVLPPNQLTFQLIKQNLMLHLYKRLDVFQDDMFRMFDQVRRIFNKKSQTYKDSIDLQIFFINKRDEICKKGEVLSSNAFAYKVTSFEEDELYFADTNTNEENVLNDILQISYLNKLKERLAGLEQKQEIVCDDGFKLCCNDFISLKKFERSFEQEHLKNQSLYNEENMIACVLAIASEKESGNHKLLVQLYLRPTDIQGHKHKYISNEILKSDIYEIVDLAQVIRHKSYVFSIKDFMNYSIECDDQKLLQQMLLCESIYCTSERLFRKVKRWQTNITNASYISTLTKLNFLNYELDKFKFNQRTTPVIVSRNFLNSNEINGIKCGDPSSARVYERPKLNVLLTLSQATAVQENENYIYYEQIYTKGQCYKLGDYVYIRHRFNERNELVPALLTQLPVNIEENNKGTLVRIDRLWRVRGQNDATQQNQLIDQNDYSAGGVVVYIKGPIFLQPFDIHHEPTRMFYKNEVFKDNTREYTTVIDSICGRCAVLSMKKYATSRPTEIYEQDVYICENKYVMEQKTCRKFTKGLKKFELSAKCFEDEVYFFKKEIRLRKFLSPLMLNDQLLMHTINNAVQAANLLANKSMDYHMDEDTNSNSNDFMHNNTSYGAHDMNTSTCSSNLGTPSKSAKHMMDKDKIGNAYKINKHGKLVKKRVKRSKKCGYNIFSKEFRKKLRDEHSSLSFIEMSREVGNHWRQMTDSQRQQYEERAKEESIKEAARMAEEDRVANEGKMKQLHHQQQQQQQQAQLQQQQLQMQQQQQQQQMIHNIPSNGQHINQIFASQTTVIKQPTQQLQAALNTPNGLASNSQSQYSIINVTPQNAVQLNLNYGQNTAYIIKQPDGTQNGNEYMQQQQQQQQMQNYQLQQQQQQQRPPPIFVSAPQKSLRPLHTEAYQKYIERLKKSQESNQRWQHQSHHDWQSCLEIRPTHMRESNMTTAAPTSWIENMQSGDVFKHLQSLRYYLLNDTFNIKRYEIVDESVEDNVIDLEQPESTQMETQESEAIVLAD